MQDVATLYIVATPIGNLEDITLRGITVLKNVSLIAAEDTRQSKKLLRHYGISTPLFSLHAHNERDQSSKIIEKLKNNESVAYITDAGTPLISDPGAYLVKTIRDHGFAVVPIPGPCAAIAALSVSGFTHPQFYFEGFLPSKPSARRQRLQDLKYLSPTLVFYESPHRIMATLNDMLEVFGNREVVIARELTKKFETIRSGFLIDVMQILNDSSEQRLGEFVVLLSGNKEENKIEVEEIESVLVILLKELPLKKAVAVASKLLPIAKNEVYALALELKKKYSPSLRTK